MHKKHKTLSIIIIFCILYLESNNSHADYKTSKELSPSEKKKLFATKFYQKIKKGFDEVTNKINQQLLQSQTENILLDGEFLFFNVRLPKSIRLDGVIFGKIRGQEIVVSLKDFAEILSFPIEIDIENQTATGWYIRENKKFDLDLKNNIVKTDVGEFKTSSNISIENDDIFIPIHEISNWIDFSIQTRISSQELVITPSQKLPAQEKLERKNKKLITNKKPEPKLPRGEEDYKAFAFPAIDITTNYRYEKNGNDGETSKDVNSTITATGDLAYGTFTTRTQYNNEENINSIRATYKQESEYSDLLGPLKARRFDIGDVNSTNIPLSSSTNQNLGLRITNKDPLKSFTQSTTVISGTTFPEWDVELYRENQFLGFQTVNSDGFFSFDNVALFNSDNDFKLIFYGPQGEIKEEIVSIPVDNNFTTSSGIYDVSLTFEDEQAYKKDQSNRDEDSGTPNLFALYNFPLSGDTIGSLSLRSNQFKGERNTVAQTGFSTLALDTLLNFDIAIDDEYDTQMELTARRNFGEHSLSSSTSWINHGFDNIDGQSDLDIFRENLTFIGPLPFSLGLNPRYSGNIDYSKTSDGNSSLTATAGFNSVFYDITVNEQITHITSTDLEDDQLNSLTTLSGKIGKNRIRTVFDYGLKPEKKLDKVVATLNHEISDNLDFNAEVQKDFEKAITQYTVGMDWDADFARLSPRIEYNSDHDLFVGLNARYSIAREPHHGDFVYSSKPAANIGGISGFVYLDKNGNLIFDGEDEPLQDVTLKALQNGGVTMTDKNGIAFFKNMSPRKITDIAVEESSLPDPLWVSAVDGLSILPREGHFDKTEFPIHISGELDGTLYGINENGDKNPLRNVMINLYGKNGDLEKTSFTDIGGFYFFSKIKPGQYYLMINEASAKRDNFARPQPQKINIGYDGTLLFGNDIDVIMGKKDVPSVIIKNANYFFDRYQHLELSNKDTDIALNLGEFKSQALMALRWYKIKKNHPELIKNSTLYISPKNSIINPKTGYHELKIGLKNTSIDDAYQWCSKIIDTNISCKIELRPEIIASK